MLTKTACQLGVNLALMLQHHNKDLTPVKGSLLDVLANASYVECPIQSAEFLDTNLALHLGESTHGTYNSTQGEKTYQPSHHDTLMDNYIETLSSLVAQQVSFSRSVVYPKIQTLSDQVTQALATCSVKQPEDFFTVCMYSLPELLTHTLIDQEVTSFTASSAAMTAMNFKEDVYSSLNLLEYIQTGDAEFDRAVATWYKSSDENRIFGYVFSIQPQIEAALSVNNFIDYSLINFLFYRSLVIRQDLQTGLSVVALTSRTANNRDYHARSLKAGIESYHQQVRQGVMLSSDSESNFSYLGDNTVCITVYQESMTQAAAQGASIEQVFGFIAQFSSAALTVEMLKAEGSNYARAWERVRGLYLTYINSQRDILFKTALKRHFAEVLTQDRSEEDQTFFNAHPGYEATSLQLGNAYINNLTADCLDKTQDVYVDLIARIAYRDSAASIIIPEMTRLLKSDPAIEPQHAALISTVKYVTTYLLDQASF